MAAAARYCLIGVHGVCGVCVPPGLVAAGRGLPLLAQHCGDGGGGDQQRQPAGRLSGGGWLHNNTDTRSGAWREAGKARSSPYKKHGGEDGWDGGPWQQGANRHGPDDAAMSRAEGLAAAAAQARIGGEAVRLAAGRLYAALNCCQTHPGCRATNIQLPIGPQVTLHPHCGRRHAEATGRMEIWLWGLSSTAALLWLS